MIKRKKVTMIQRVLPHYRERFFDILRGVLVGMGIDFTLVYGEAEGEESEWVGKVEIPWGVRIRNRRVAVGGRGLFWQPCLGLVKGADLVIVEQAGKLLTNYVFLVAQIFGLMKIGFWGHGKNFKKHSEKGLGTVAKQLMCRHAHWWFAYNDVSAEIVRKAGFPDNRVTSVQNAIDTRCLVEAKSMITEERLSAKRLELGIKGTNVAIYIGGMYPEKRIDFLLKACCEIRRQIKDFHMIFIGAGPLSGLVREASISNEWIHYVGPKFGSEKVPYMVLSKLLLMPGLVGLAVLDAFALETPLVTTDLDYHSPEVNYLIDGVNGVIVPGTRNPDVYAAAVSDIFMNERLRERLAEGCRTARAKYTVEEMAAKFASGIKKALDL